MLKNTRYTSGRAVSLGEPIDIVAPRTRPRALTPRDWVHRFFDRPGLKGRLFQSSRLAWARFSRVVCKNGRRYADTTIYLLIYYGI
jgi:hypothetical protein